MATSRYSACLCCSQSHSAAKVRSVCSLCASVQMYLSASPSLLAASPVTAPAAAGVAASPVRAGWLRIALWWLWKWFLRSMGDMRTLIVRVIVAARAYSASLKPSLNYLLNKFVSLLLDWPATSFELVTHIGEQSPSTWCLLRTKDDPPASPVRNYPHPVHLTAWLIFFGPLAIICPLLLLYEAFIAIVFQLTFLFHGLIPGSVEEIYLDLREATDDAKQWMYVYIDQATNTYNKWTMESNPLLVARLVAGAIGLYILYCIWFFG